MRWPCLPCDRRGVLSNRVSSTSGAEALSEASGQRLLAANWFVLGSVKTSSDGGLHLVARILDLIV
jgi:hypothetical protein